MSLWNFSNSILIDYSQFFWIIFNRNFVKWQSTWIRMGKTDVCKLVELVLKPVFPGSEHLQLLATLRQQIFLKNWGGFSHVGEHFVGFYQSYPLNWNTTMYLAWLCEICLWHDSNRMILTGGQCLLRFHHSLQGCIEDGIGCLRRSGISPSPATGLNIKDTSLQNQLI